MTGSHASRERVLWEAAVCCQSNARKTEARANAVVRMRRKVTWPQVHEIITDIIKPNLVWVAGRVCGAVRSICIATMWTLLRSGVMTSRAAGDVTGVFASMMRPLMAMLEDENKTSRLTTAKVVRRSVARVSGAAFLLVKFK